MIKVKSELYSAFFCSVLLFTGLVFSLILVFIISFFLHGKESSDEKVVLFTKNEYDSLG